MAGGRPKGAKDKTKRTTAARKVANAAAEDGVLPLDYMLNVMRNPKTPESRRDAMAVSAAPYVHPRLANTTSTVTVRRDAAEYSREELLAIASGGSAGTAAPDGRGREPSELH